MGEHADRRITRCRWPLGKRGPRTFISYSFKEPQYARRLAAHLLGRGFQVTLFDRSSLVGAELHAALARAISAAEVVVQVYATEQPSDGMREELALATSRMHESGFRLVPVSLVDPYTLPELIREIAYIDGTNVSEPVWWDDAEQASLKTVVLLRIDEENPFMLDELSSRAVLARDAVGKRLIVDSDGLLLRRLCEYRRDVEESERRPLDFGGQMGDYVDFTQRRLALLDRIAGRVIDEIRTFYHGWGSSSPMEATPAVQRFWRLGVGLYLLLLAGQGVKMGSLQAQAEKALADIERRQRGHASMDLGRYWWALEWPRETSRSHDWLDLDFVGPKATIPGRAFLPASRLLPGTTPIRADPRDGLRARDWVDYVIPQIGRQAFAADDWAMVDSLPWTFDQVRWFGLH